MKRSEAIKKLSWILSEASGHVAEEINPEWLLNRIELDLEMLPPMSNETISQHNLSTVEAMLDSVIYDFKWDKEDETK